MKSVGNSIYNVSGGSVKNGVADQLQRRFSLFLVCVRFDKDCFIIGINDKSRLTFIRFFNVFSFTVIHRDFISVPSVGVVCTYLRSV